MQTHITKNDLAKLMGLKSFDCALPQPWLVDVVATLKRTGFGRVGMLPDDLYDKILMGTVWSYDKDTIGRPVALTEEVESWLKMYDSHRRS